jgi:acetyl esterase/lipase
MSTVSLEQDHVFATVGETVLALDLYRAPRVDAPLVVYVHGGGRRRGDKADGGVARLRPMAAHGVTVASVNYRLVPGATFPDQLHDLKGAVRWPRAHGTSLGVPTGRVGI